MSYTHKTGTVINSYNNHEEHCFYEDTTKRQMFLIIEQMSTLLKGEKETWVDRANSERELLKINGIK
jgi:hypothetical protein